MCICFCTSICIYRNAGSWKPVQRDGTTPRSKKLNVWILHQPQRWVLFTFIEIMRFINHNGIELPRGNHILILLKGKWECCAGKPRAKEQHSEGCWHNTPSVDSFNGQTPHIVNNIILSSWSGADTFLTFPREFYKVALRTHEFWELIPPAKFLALIPCWNCSWH